MLPLLDARVAVAVRPLSPALRDAFDRLLRVPIEPRAAMAAMAVGFALMEPWLPADSDEARSAELVVSNPYSPLCQIVQQGLRLAVDPSTPDALAIAILHGFGAVPT